MQHASPLRTTRLAIAALALAAGTHTAVQAHYVWIEHDAQGTTLYFGEYQGNLREASPGLLDKFAGPVALKHGLHGAGGSTPVPLRKTAAGFVADVKLAAGESLTAEDAGYPISERKQGDQVTRSLYHPAARWVGSWAAQEPKLKLDLVPTGKQGKQGNGGIELRASFNGQPLPKAKVTLFTAAGWERELHTADDGTLAVTLPWRGTYVLALSHSETTGGERAGRKYDRASYITSLTLQQPEGLQPLPALAAVPPNKPN
jgi:hypothetical protein